MRILTTIILVLIGLVIISGVAFFGYQFYQRLHAPAESPFKAISPNSALILRINKPSILWNESKHGNVLWQDLFSIQYISSIKGQVNFLDSVLQTNQRLSHAFRNEPLFIVLSQSVTDSYGLLYMINIPTGTSEDEITEFIQKTWPSGIDIKKSSYAGSSIREITDRAGKSSFFYTIRSGILMISSRQMLVKQAIDRLSLNLAAADDQNFQKIVDLSGKNVDANIFLNYEKIAPFMAGVFKNGIMADYLNVSHFAAWTGLDIIQRKDAWLVSGYTVCNENSFEYLSHFSDQSARAVSMSAILPGNAASFIWIGLSNPEAYYDKLTASRSSTSIYKPVYPILLQIENISQIQLVDYFLPWTGSEMGLIRYEGSAAKDTSEVFGVFRVKDRLLADSLLQKLGKQVFNLAKKEPFKGNTFYNLNIPDVVPGVWGNLFQQLHGSCYTFIDEYIVFGNDISSLKDFSEKFAAGNVLDKDPDYLSYSENLSEKSSLCYYFNLRTCFSEFRNMLSDEISRELNPYIDSLRAFESFGAQVINNGENLITNIFITHLGTEQDKGPLLWQTSLDTVISGSPMIVMDAVKGSPGVLAYDKANTMYLADWTGNIQWKLKLPGQPVGDVIEIRPKGSDRSCFLFNTLNHICIVDRNGLFAYNSPFPLPSPSAAGLTSLELPSPGNYRILIPLRDKKVYSFDLSGKQSPGWNKPSMDEQVAKPVQLLKYQNKDFLFIASVTGQVLVTDIKGNPVIRPGSGIKFSPASAFYLNKTNSKGSFLSSSEDGKLLYLRNDGKTADLKFNNFTRDHVFFYADFNNDKIQDFIYYDLNRIYFYNRFQKLLYDYTFPSQVLPPFFLRSLDGDFLLGTVSPISGEIFLFGNNGLLPLDPAIRGTAFFDVRKVDGDPGLYLSTGSGKVLKVYQLSK